MRTTRANLAQNQPVRAIARAFTKDEEGATATEYAAMLALIVAGSMAVITALSGHHAEIWEAIATATSGSVGGP